MSNKVSFIPLLTSSKRGGDKMSATFEAKSEESVPLGDDQKNQLLPDDASDELKEEEKIKEDDSKLPEKTRHPLDTSFKLFPLHTWLYILYVVLAILLPIFGTLLILCGNYTNTGYFSLFAILNYPWPKLKLEDPNATATSLELLQVGAILVLSRESKNSKICSFPHIDLVFWSLLQFKGYIYLNLSFYFKFASTFMSPDTSSSTGPK